MPEYVLSQAGPESLEEVLSLLRQNQLPTEGVAENFDNFTVARVGSRIIGTVGLERYDTQALLRSLVVSPEYRGHGVGQALVKACIEKAREGGFKELYLLTTTAVNYFPRFGFKPIERSQVSGRVLDSVEFKHSCPCSAAVMLTPL